MQQYLAQPSRAQAERIPGSTMPDRSDSAAATAQFRLSEAVNSSPALRSQMQLSAALNQSPAMVAQRRLAATLHHGVNHPTPAGDVTQRVYLWDRTSKVKAEPQWEDIDQPPRGYLISGRFNDGTNGEDDVYARLKPADLFYGIGRTKKKQRREIRDFTKALEAIAKSEQFSLNDDDGIERAISIYESSGRTPLIDLDFMKETYGGSLGFDRYSDYLPGSGKYRNFGIQLVVQNPDLPWADPKSDQTSFACQVTMIEALRLGGSVRFLLDGMQKIAAILNQTDETLANNVTSRELRFAIGLLGQSVTVSKSRTITPVDGENVFFYRNRALIPAERISYSEHTDSGYDSGYEADDEMSRRRSRT